MRVLVYLIALLIVGTAVAQNPTIIQGSYITNVFGNSNFVLNPNARTDTTNVVPVNATVTRSTTTPLVATSEFLVTTSTSTGTISWPLRVFDQGMKGQNCEARFSYRGFSVGSTTAQIVQGSNVVAQLTLTPSTDPRIASINFPCGDLSSATTFRLQQATASLTGTNEIGGIYVGLATNQANVAQAELVGSVTLPGGTNCIPRTSSATFAFLTLATNCGTPTYTGNVANFSQDPFGFEVRNLKVGNYQIVISGSGFGMNGNGEGRFYLQDTTNSVSSMQKRIYTANAGETVYSTEVFNLEYTSQPTSTATFRFYGLKSPSGDAGFYGNASNFRISVYRFPSSSELVVTPERQNTWAGIKAYSGGDSNNVTTGVTTKLTSVGTLTRETFGRALVESNNDYSITIRNMPVGSYQVTAQGWFFSVSSASGVQTQCVFTISDNPTAGTTIAGYVNNSYGDATAPVQQGSSSILTGVYYNSSVADRTFYVRANKSLGNACKGYTDQPSTPLIMIITPLDQPSNSALYVQGPVQGSNTNTAIPTNSIGGKVIDASLARTTSVLGVWQVAPGNFGTPPAGSYLMMINSVGTATGGLTGTGSIVNESGSSVTPVVCQLNSINSSANDTVYGRVCYYTTDGTKTLYAWAQATGANTTVTTALILVRLN